MKKRLVILTALLSLSIPMPMALASQENTPTQIETTEENIVYENLIEQSFLSRGTKAPSGSSYLDLSKNTYNFDVEYKYAVFTNSQFSGTTTMSVKVNSIKVNKNGMKNESKGITVRLFNSSGKEISSKSVGLSGDTVKFSGLSKSTKYYVKFTKTDDTQIYSFSGTIKK